MVLNRDLNAEGGLTDWLILLRYVGLGFSSVGVTYFD